MSGTPVMGAEGLDCLEAYIDGVDRLLHTPVFSKAGLVAWEREATRLWLAFRDAEYTLSVPEVVWHFVSDADIRFKEHRAVVPSEVVEALKQVRDDLDRARRQLPPTP